VTPNNQNNSPTPPIVWNCGGCALATAGGGGGAGGTGGGGSGGLKYQTSPAVNDGFAATPNSGSGGGGASNINSAGTNGIGGAGGSGIVVVRYISTYTITYTYNGADGARRSVRDLVGSATT